MNDDKNPATKPLFVTEEEHTAPPAPPALGNQGIGISGKQGIGSSVPGNPIAGSPDTLIPTPPTPPTASAAPVVNIVNNPTPPPGDDSPPKKNSGPILPPIMEVPKKKGKGKLIAGLAAVLLLVVSIPLAVFVIGQNTELRNRAAQDGDGGGGCSDLASDPPATVRTETDGDGCTRNVHVRADCSEYQGGPYACPSTQAPPPPAATTPAASTPAPSTGGGDNSGDNSGPVGGNAGICGRDAGEAVKASDGTDIYSQGCSVVNAFADKYGTQAGAWWAARHNLEVVCNPTGIGMDTAACDGQTMLSQNSLGVLTSFYGYGSKACINWVEEHNKAVNYCGGSPPAGTTGSGTSTATGGGAGSANQCTGVKIYKYPFQEANLVSSPYNGKLVPGDRIQICLLTSGSGGSAEVNVNSSGWGSANQSGPNRSNCYDHTIAADATTLRFEARY